MKQLNIHQSRTILKSPTLLVCANAVIYPIFAFKYSTAHCKYDMIIVHHKSESVTSFMHNDLMFCFMGNQ